MWRVDSARSNKWDFHSIFTLRICSSSSQLDAGVIWGSPQLYSVLGYVQATRLKRAENRLYLFSIFSYIADTARGDFEATGL
jgi:hypothetical protein